KAFARGVQERASTDEQRTSPTLAERRKGRLDVAVAAGFDNDEFLSDRVCGGLHISPLALGLRVAERGTHEPRNGARLGHKLAQQLQPLRSCRASEKAHAGRVAAGSVEACDEALDHRVAAGREYDWYRRSCSLGREGRRSISDD